MASQNWLGSHHHGAAVDWVTAIEEFLRSKRKLAPKTVEFYRAQLRLLAGWALDQKIPFERFTGRHLDAYDEYRAREGSAERSARNGVSRNTRRHDAVCARQLFRCAYRAGLIDRDPLAGYEITRPDRATVAVPTEDEVAQLLRAAEDFYDVAENPSIRNVDARRRLLYRRRNRAILCLLVETAARIHELLNVRFEDYQPKQGRVWLRKTKSGTPRFVPCKAVAQAAMEDWLRVRPKEAGAAALDPVFISQFGSQADYDDFSRTFTAIRGFARLRHFTLHGLRHYSLHCLAHDGTGGILDAMVIAGHTDPKTTMTYMHAQFETATLSHDAANPLGRLFNSPKQLRQQRRRLF